MGPGASVIPGSERKLLLSGCILLASHAHTRLARTHTLVFEHVPCSQSSFCLCITNVTPTSCDDLNPTFLLGPGCLFFVFLQLLGGLCYVGVATVKKYNNKRKKNVWRANFQVAGGEKNNSHTWTVMGRCVWELCSVGGGLLCLIPSSLCLNT